MTWLSAHYQWVVVGVVMPIFLLLLKHWVDSRKKTADQTSWMELFKEKQRLGEQVASLEAQIPTVMVFPTITTGKDDTYWLREKIERKKNEIRKIEERLKLLAPGG